MTYWQDVSLFFFCILFSTFYFELFNHPREAHERQREDTGGD